MKGSGQVRLHALRNIEDLEARADSWDACVAAAGGDIYFTTGWLRIWWRHFGARRDFRGYVLTTENEGGSETIGVIALALETHWLGPLPVRIARLAGMDPNYAIMGFPIASAHAEAAWRLIMEDLLGPCGREGISLSPVSDHATGLEAVRAAADAAAGAYLAVDAAQRQHTVMYLPASKEDYHTSLSKSRQREVKRSRNKMEKAFDLAHHTSGPEDAAARFDAFAEQHTRQWQSIGKGGHFVDWPGSAAFYREVLGTLSEDGSAIIEQHMGNDEVLSSQMTFLLGDRACWRLTSRTLDEDAIRMGVGKVGAVERVEALIARGVRTIEVGAGEYGYKLSYGGELVGLRQLVVGRVNGSWRLRLLLGWARLLDLAYYRIWFLKLAPRWRAGTGARPRPLWRSWIKTRL